MFWLVFLWGVTDIVRSPTKAMPVCQSLAGCNWAGFNCALRLLEALVAAAFCTSLSMRIGRIPKTPSKSIPQESLHPIYDYGRVGAMSIQDAQHVGSNSLVAMNVSHASSTESRVAFFSAPWEPA